MLKNWKAGVLKKVLLVLVTGLLCSVFLEWATTTDWNYLFRDNENYPAMTRSLSQVTLVDYSASSEGLTAASSDPKILIDSLPKNIKKMAFVFSEPLKAEQKIQIYYRLTDGDTYTDKYSVTGYGEPGQTKAVILVNVTAVELRIDMDAADSGAIPLQSIILNYSSYKDFLLPYTSDSPGRIILYWTFLSLAAGFVFFGWKKTLHFVCRYRYAVAAVVVLVFTLGKISGSSIARYSDILPGADFKPALGSTLDHSDEWNIFTTLSIAQDKAGYPYYSDLLRGTATDMSVIYGQPIRDIITVFRPFMLVYLFAGCEYGLAFFWIARMAALFLVTFELGLLLLKGDRKYALTMALLISLSPLVQWWFSVNGTAELFIFPELAILMFDRYLKTAPGEWKKKIPYAACLAWCAMSFALILYPAWQIPMAYLTLVLAVWVIRRNRKTFRFGKSDLISLAVFLMILAAAGLHYYRMSGDAIHSIMNTAYPGQRISTGGTPDYLKFLFGAWGNLFTQHQTKIAADLAEKTAFFDFFPAGILLSVYAMAKKKKADFLPTALIITEAVFLSYFLFQWPVLLAKVTLLSLTTAFRIKMVIEVINILLLLMAMKELSERGISTAVKASLAVLAAVSAGFALYLYQDTQPAMELKLLMAGAAAVGFYLIGRSMAKNEKLPWLVYVTVISMAAGFFVNPVQVGLSDVENNVLVREIEAVNTESPGKWIVTDSSNFTVGNIPLLAGASTVNSTNIYENTELWKVLDSSGQHKDDYNRYMHLTVNIGSSEEISYSLDAADHLTVTMNLENVKKTGAEYILSITDLSGFATDSDSLTLLFRNGVFYIYRLS